MAVAGLQPQPDSDVASGRFLTFVVPAPDGCDLKCPFCVVEQRQEITETRLGPEDYVRFIREAAQQGPVFALAIQGYEPLRPESLPYTRAILATGQFLKLPASLVTNGTRLGETVDFLRTLSPAKIAVSLDAAKAGTHDRIRGAGAFAAAVASIRQALKVLAPQTRLAVASVLIPARRHYLDDMPARLREIGINRWIITPLLRLSAGGPVGDRMKLFRDLLILQEAADRAGISCIIDDELGHLSRDAASDALPLLRALHVRRLPPNVELFRLTPGGQCSSGNDVLRPVPAGANCWHPGVIHAGDFLNHISTRADFSRRPFGRCVDSGT